MKTLRLQSILFLLIIVMVLPGCYTTRTDTMNVPFLLNDKKDQMSWDEFEAAVLPKLEEGQLKLTKAETYQLFSRAPNIFQSYSDALSVVSGNPAMVQLQGHQGGMQVNSIAAFRDQVVTLRGAVWIYNNTKGSKLKTLISESDKDASQNYFILTVFYKDKLVHVESMSESQARSMLAWTSETIIDYGVKASLYAVPAIILARALTQAATTIGNSAERSANTLAGSFDRGADKLGNSIDTLSGAVDRAHPNFNTINDALNNLNGSLSNALKSGGNANLQWTGPNGTSGSVTITAPK